MPCRTVYCESCLCKDIVLTPMNQNDLICQECGQEMIILVNLPTRTLEPLSRQEPPSFHISS